MLSLFKLPSPVQEIKSDLYSRFDLKVFLKRDDLIHPIVSGNKWRKLKYSIQYALKHEMKGVLTFGGAFSNHLHATAYACHYYNLSSISIIRGEYADVNNPTLSDVIEQGTHLIHVSREEYRLRNDPKYIEQLQNKYPEYLIIPEGGRSEHGMKGVGEIWNELTLEFDHIIVPVGSSTTLCGLILNKPSKSSTRLHGVACVKDKSLMKRIMDLNSKSAHTVYHDQYVQGGFAKVNAKLIHFINQFKKDHNIQLDPIYTAKMFMAFHDMIDQEYFDPGSFILLVHTGGLQGIRGHNRRYQEKLDLQINT